MVGIVLASHGKFAEGIKESGSMIFGPQEDVAAVVLTPDMGPDDMHQKLLDAISTCGEGRPSTRFPVSSARRGMRTGLP